MAIYLCFSDENGMVSSSINNKHPFYFRSSIIIQADEWQLLKEKFFKLKESFNLPLEKEIKWSYLWSLHYYQKKEKPIKDKDPFKFLEGYSFRDLKKFIEQSIQLLEYLKYSKIIFTITRNPTKRSNQQNYLKWHLQEHMQRIEMELQSSNDNLCFLFIDQIGEQNDTFLKEVYYELFIKGDLIKKYSHIKDSLIIECSHHSVGIQLADFISGCFSSVIKGHGNDNYSIGKALFKEHIYSRIRRADNGDILGYGIIEVPKNQDFRCLIEESLSFCDEINKGYENL